jgi:hypothetical protein
MSKKPGSQKDNTEAIKDMDIENLAFGEPLFIWRKI